MPRARLLVLAFFVALAAGCAGATTGGRSARSDLVTQEQIQGRGFATAYDAVEALRGGWLRTRGATTLMGPEAEIQVYLDNTRLGGIATLRQIPAVNVTYIQWYNSNDATARWGIGHGAGAIFVSTAPAR